MPVLAYCITETEPEIRTTKLGVGDAEIKVLNESGLRCFLSDFADQLPVQGKSNSAPALAFGRVLREIFQQVAVIPFCFPTVLSSEAEFATFVREHAAEYREDLSRLRRSVQMEIQISPQPLAQPGSSKEQSGKEYMRKRQMRHQELKAALGEFRRAAEEWIEGWREKEVAGGMRGYALIARASTQAFLEKMGSVCLPKDLQARVSGPWPATQFLKESDVGE